MTVSRIRIPTDQPQPFIFLSENYALESNGATVWVYDSGDGVLESTNYPIENIIDGNRATYAHLSQICSFYPAHGVVRFDLSDSMEGGKEINMLVLENDSRIPLRSLRVLSFTDSLFTAGMVEHTISYDKNLVLGPYTFYDYGMNPKVDGAVMGQEFNPSAGDRGNFECFDGRNLVILLEEPITTPYVDIRFASPGRNAFGMDGVVENGIWADAEDETLETGDPYPDTAGNNNHMKLNASSGGADVVSRWFTFQIREDWMYYFSYATKSNGLAGDGLYQYQITYLDGNKNSIGSSELMYSNMYSGLSWTVYKDLINIPVGSDKYSGSNDWYHKMPDGARYVQIRFKIVASATTALEMKVSDMRFYAQNIPSDVSDLATYVLNNAVSADAVVYQIFEYNDQSGSLKLHRIGMHSYNFSTSKKAGSPAWAQDLGGYAGSNPSQITEGLSGKVIMEDIHGAISAQFMPKAGAKTTRTLQIVCPKEQRLAINDLYQSSTAFGLVDPQGDFGDYTILNVEWNIIDPEDISKPQDYLWSGSITVREI